MSAAESSVVQISPDELDHQDSAARTTPSCQWHATGPADAWARSSSRA